MRLVLPGELAKHAVSEGTKAVMKYSEKSATMGSKSTRCGLQFPVGRIHRMLRAAARLRIGSGAPVYLAAVAEYMSAEVLELAGNCARDNKRNRLNPRDVQLAIRNDEELAKFCRHVVVPGGGVVPSIHAVLVGFKAMNLGDN